MSTGQEKSTVGQQPKQSCDLQSDELALRAQLFEGLNCACEAFPPLFDLLGTLAKIDNRDREGRDALLLAFHAFLQKVDLPSESGKLNANPLTILTDLISAFDDLNCGREPHLFQRKEHERVANRSMKTDWGIAADLIISARRYLHNKMKASGESSPKLRANEALAHKLHGLKVQIDDKEIDSLCKTHNRENDRRTNRPDLRGREIETDAALSIVVHRIAYIMKGRTS